MDMMAKNTFLKSWQVFFNNAELPLAFYYKDEEDCTEQVPPPTAHMCMIGVLAKARKGTSLCFDIDSIGCGGGKRYSGFTNTISPTFEHFLSCGIPGKIEGERYKKSPEIVRELMKLVPQYKAPARFLVFKRFDALEETDNPEAFIFFAAPDVLSGLFTLANFDEIEPNGVFCPFGAGCASIVQYPYLENQSPRPRAVLGMFDVSARPYVPNDTLTFAVPMNKFIRMIGNMEESFLITRSWDRVRRRIA
jgi:Uncharacterised ArCR, COG2043